MEHLIKSLPAIMRAAANSGEVTEAACIAAWNHAVGEGLRNNAIPIEFRDRRLIVAVADRIWQRQLQTMLGQLLYRLNAVLGQQLVTSIELRVDAEIVASCRPTRPVRQKSGDEVPPDLRSAARSIEDQHLREAFLGAAAICLKRREFSGQ